MKKIRHLAFLIINLCLLSNSSWARIDRDTVFDIYSVGNFEPSQVTNSGYVIGIDPTTAGVKYWSWNRDGDYHLLPETSLSDISWGPLFYDGNSIIGDSYLFTDTVSLADFPTSDLIVGTASNNDWETRGIIKYSAGSASPSSELIPTLGGRWSKANAMIDPGVIGAAENSIGQSRAIYYSPRLRLSSGRADFGEITVLNQCFPNYTNSSANDSLTSFGSITGTYQYGNTLNRTRSYYLVDIRAIDIDLAQHCIDLGTLGGRETVASVISSVEITSEENPQPIIAGWSRDGNNRQRAFSALIHGGGAHPLSVEMTNLGTLTASANSISAATGVNFEGVVVGWSRDLAESDSKAFVFIPGVGMRDLNTLLRDGTGEWNLIRANYISKQNEYIVGVGYYTPRIPLMKGSTVSGYIWGKTTLQGFILTPSVRMDEKETLFVQKK
ncbi:MAG: hypothetical protein IPJ69_14795 [Deltaproteobacteria bacterium]|nr:MAG: hypothetical protein IPJ69_14795 [Deltaproteobacteria bacterium]